MSVCPPPFRKYTAFEPVPLARGLHSSPGMRNAILFLSTLLAAIPLSASTGVAQTEQADAITEINDETLTADVTKVYFNAANCADPANTTFDLTLANGDGVQQAYLWAGTENAGCEQETNRTDQTLRCRPMDSNPRTVGDNATIFNLTLQELIDTEVIDCENTSLEGAPFSIYAFRNEDPGGENVAVEGYGVAPFRVDVTPPDQLTLTSAPRQEGSSFTVAWNSPTDSQSIPQYRLYAAATDDPDAALANGILKTAGIDKKSLSVTIGELSLAPGEEIYLFASAVDEAAVTIGNGNQGPLSDTTLGIAAETSGFCDDPNVDCSGCSVSPLLLPHGQPSAGLWVIGLVFAIVAGWRLRR